MRKLISIRGGGLAGLFLVCGALSWPGTPLAQAPDKLTIGELAHLQEMLIWTGHLNAEVGRVPVEELVDAIKSFQKASKSPVTGSIKPSELAALTRQGEAARERVGFQIIDDPKTGVRVGMPTSLVGLPSPATHGPHWRSSDSAISINTLAIPLSRHTLDSLFQRMCCEISGRRVEHKERYPDWFVIEGTEGERSYFHVRAHAGANEVRGLSVVIDKRRKAELMPVINAMASTFRPFPAPPTAIASLVPPPATALKGYSAELPKGGTVPAPKPEPADRMSDEAQMARLKQQIAELHAKIERLVAAPPVPAQPGQLTPAPAPAAIGRRVALVIGNTLYRNTAELSNPYNDAKVLTEALKSIGFEAIEGLDLDHERMASRIRAFARALEDAEIGLFFYAGHALQVGGRNYLMPVDARLERESHILHETIELADVMKHLEAQAKVKIVILDACRDNPLARRLAEASWAGGRTRSAASGVGEGLAPVEAGVGSLIVFSTAPGQVALDGKGHHSPFTEALLRHLRTPGLEIGMLFRRVRDDVRTTTGGRQVPWEHSSLGGSAIALVPPRK